MQLWGLFFTGLLSATLLPGGSEANVVWLVHSNQVSMIAIIFVATLGNTFGGMINFIIGRCLPERFLTMKRGQDAINWLRQYGYWSLLFSWLPIVGDPLCLAAGWLRWRWWLSALLMFIGKGVRYALLVWLVHSV